VYNSYLILAIPSFPVQSVYEYVNEDNNNAYRAGPIRFDPLDGYNEKPISAVRTQIIGQHRSRYMCAVLPNMLLSLLQLTKLSTSLLFRGWKQRPDKL
jgi:hypothetical protein